MGDSLLTCYVINSESKEVLEYLRDSGRISFFVGMISHEAYNFKGQFIVADPLTDEDLKISEDYRNKVIETISSIGIPNEVAIEKYGKDPDVGITFKVDHVFVQTPGPDAGKEINE